MLIFRVMGQMKWLWQLGVDVKLCGLAERRQAGLHLRSAADLVSLAALCLFSLPAAYKLKCCLSCVLSRLYDPIPIPFLPLLFPVILGALTHKLIHLAAQEGPAEGG